MAAKAETQERMGGGPTYFLEIDAVEYEWPSDSITGAEVMDLAGIPHDQGVVLMHDDGTQESIAPDKVVDLKPGQRLKKRPKFKRG